MIRITAVIELDRDGQQFAIFQKLRLSNWTTVTRSGQSDFKRQDDLRMGFRSREVSRLAGFVLFLASIDVVPDLSRRKLSWASQPSQPDRQHRTTAAPSASARARFTERGCREQRSPRQLRRNPSTRQVRRAVIPLL